MTPRARFKHLASSPKNASHETRLASAVNLGCRSMMKPFLTLLCAFLSLSAYAECFRFDMNLAQATTVTATPVPAGVDCDSLFEIQGPLAWRAAGLSAKSHVRTESDCLVFTTQEEDWLISPVGLNISPSSIARIEIDLRVTGQDCIQVRRGLLLDWWPRVIRVPRRGEFTTICIDPRAQEGWSLSKIDRLMIGLAGAGCIEIKAVRTVPQSLSAPVGTGFITRDNTNRHALFGYCPMSLEYKLHVPEGAFFSAGLSGREPANAVTFRVTVHQGDSDHVVLNRTADPRTWSEIEADLSAFADTDVTVQLAATCDVPGQVALWSNPAILQKRAGVKKMPPNIVLYVVDALRADHLDIYGYPRKTAPHIAAWAETGLRFALCLSQATWTPASAPSYQASVGPLTHGSNALLGKGFPPTLVTFPELLRNAGYTTEIVTDNGLASPDCAPRCAYGVAVYEAATTTHAVKFIEENGNRPFMLYVHSMECHFDADVPRDKGATYSPPPPYRGMFASGGNDPKDSYDECIAFADSNFGRFMERLNALGLSKNTLVILTADHGEAFLEHDLTDHGGAPYIELLHVPFLVSWPGTLPAGKVVNETVSLLDLAPTVLDYAGLSIPEQFQGISMRGLIDGSNAGPFRERTVFSYGIASACSRSVDRAWARVFVPLLSVSPKLFAYLYRSHFDDAFSAIKMPWALFSQYPDGPRRLYNLETDPAESCDVGAQHPDILNAMSEQTDDYRRKEAALHDKFYPDKGGDSTSGRFESLEALGYLGR